MCLCTSVVCDCMWWLCCVLLLTTVSLPMCELSFMLVVYCADLFQVKSKRCIGSIKLSNNVLHSSSYSDLLCQCVMGCVGVFLQFVCCLHVSLIKLTNNVLHFVEHDRDLHRCVWRSDPSETRVTRPYYDLLPWTILWPHP